MRAPDGHPLAGSYRAWHRQERDLRLARLGPTFVNIAGGPICDIRTSGIGTHCRVNTPGRLLASKGPAWRLVTARKEFAMTDATLITRRCIFAAFAGAAATMIPATVAHSQHPDAKVLRLATHRVVRGTCKGDAHPGWQLSANFWHDASSSAAIKLLYVSHGQRREIPLGNYIRHCHRKTVGASVWRNCRASVWQCRPSRGFGEARDVRRRRVPRGVNAPRHRPPGSFPMPFQAASMASKTPSPAAWHRPSQQLRLRQRHQLAIDRFTGSGLGKLFDPPVGWSACASAIAPRHSVTQ